MTVTNRKIGTITPMTDLASLWKRIRGSAVFMGLAGTFIRQAGYVLLLPVALHKLDPSEMALWYVFVATGALANLADFGFGQAITRVYSFYWAGAKEFHSEGLKTVEASSGPNLAGVQEFTIAVRRLYHWLTVAAAIILIAGGSWFIAPSNGAKEVPHVWILWGAYVAAILFTLCSSYWTLALQGINQVRELQRANLWAGIGFLASAFPLILTNWGLTSMVVATAVRAVLTRELCVRVYRRTVRLEPHPTAAPNFDMLKRLWPSAWKFGTISLAVYMVNQGTVLISRRLLSDEMTASYGVSAQIAGVIGNIAGLWLMVKFPQITILRTQGALREMSILFARRLGWTMLTYFLLAATVVMIGNPLLEWKGSQNKFLPTPCLILLFAYSAQQLFTTQFVFLTYTENVVPYYFISIFTGIGMVTVSILLTRKFGIWGLVWAPIFATLPATCWYPVWRGFKGQALTVREFIRAATFRRVSPADPL